jgi:formylglycine-generating enzyme required for sulfatase activity
MLGLNYQANLPENSANSVTNNRTLTARVFEAPSTVNMSFEETLTKGAVAIGFPPTLNGQPPLALNVNGTEETTRFLMPDALKEKESAITKPNHYDLVTVGAADPSAPSSSPGMVTVQGGTLPQASGLAGTIVPTFEIGRFEVTWNEWQEVRAWAVENEYHDLENIGVGSVGNHPVQWVSWFDVVKWCNAKSEQEGLSPVYTVNGATYRTGQQAPSLNARANGYRLPSEAEWEWAARGGVLSRGYTYSGSNDANAVAWHSRNSGDGTKAVGTKAPNELGIYDMSGNVWEWCWDLYNPAYSNRRIRGGSWFGFADTCTVAYRVNYSFPGDRYFFGLRLARSVAQ